MGLAEGGDLFSFVDAMGLPAPGAALEEALQPLAAHVSVLLKSKQIGSILKSTNILTNT